ncbi:MAG TPA: hypothetical protein ENJ87_04915 [Gammaproteobacteria bacterium]|nr:hypothetical protein [Gammaproteobacteria bacterium]
MNIFILNAGRCGSTTFIKACQHIQNYTATHESLLPCTGAQRLDYPDEHIEADNRLSWILGRLDQKYGNDAFYVHLKRHHLSAAESFTRRIDYGILRAYEQGILMHEKHRLPAGDIAKDYLDTVECNIRLFLRDKINKMDVHLESIETDFTLFWNRIQAQGNLEHALKEWAIRYNAS